MNKTLLIGGGGHARSLLEVTGPDAFTGYVALSSGELPLHYIGHDDVAVETYNPKEYRVHIAVGINGGCRLSLRRSIIDKFARFKSVTVIAPTATITPGCSIGDGCCIMHRAVIVRSTLGEHCVVNTGAIIDHDCHIGSNAFLAPGAILCGEVTLGNDVFIGAGAIVRNGVKISSEVSVAMGAVVTRDLNSPGVYAGNPAKLIKE